MTEHKDHEAYQNAGCELFSHFYIRIRPRCIPDRVFGADRVAGVCAYQ